MLKLALAPNRTPPPPPTTITWNPMQLQFADPDTTFLFDPDADAAAGIGVNSGAPGALINQADATAPSLVAGKFRTGARATTATKGSAGLWMPLEGILGTQEFTVEFWVTLFQDLAAMSNQEPLQIGTNNIGINYCLFNLSAGRISCTLAHQQNPGVVGTYSVSATNATAYTTGTYPVGTKLSISATLTGGTLTLYVGKDGDTVPAQIGQVTGFVSPQVWAATNTRDGIIIGAGKDGTANNLIVDSIRISRYARPLNTPVTLPTDLSTITVSNTATGLTVGKMNGHQKPFTGGNVPTAPLATAGTTQGSLRGMSLYRGGKYLNVTPIKAGGTDGTHPSLGHSGSYSYDWQVVDREMALINGTYGEEIYITLGHTPQLLGGTVAPYSGTKLTTGYAYNATLPSAVPNDINAFATVCADLVYHVRSELGLGVNYWSVWNEPDNAAEWQGTQTDYLNMYGAVASACKAVDPAVKMGAGELAQFFDFSNWAPAIVNYCAANNKPLDFFPIHYYGGGSSLIVGWGMMMQSFATTAGIPVPELFNGEWGWPYYGSYPFRQPSGTSSNNPPPSPQPFTVDYEFDDWAAAFRTSDMIRMQLNGFTHATVFTGADASLFDLTGTQQASYNSMLQWSKTLGNSILSITGPGTSGVDPGMTVLASQGAGKVYVLIANRHNRRVKTAYPVKIDLTAFGFANGTNATIYTVDDLTSNDFYGSGPGLASSSTTVQSNLVSLTGARALRARSSTLVVAG